MSTIADEVKKLIMSKINNENIDIEFGEGDIVVNFTYNDNYNHVMYYSYFYLTIDEITNTINDLYEKYVNLIDLINQRVGITNNTIITNNGTARLELSLDETFMFINNHSTIFQTKYDAFDTIRQWLRLNCPNYHEVGKYTKSPKN